MTIWTTLKRFLGRKVSAPPIDDATGPFASAFEGGELKVPGYLTLLHADGSDCQVVIRRVQTALKAPQASEVIPQLLSDRNWRPHLVAAVAILLADDSARFAHALWSAVDAGSWVAPQLVVTLRFTDPDFVEGAKRRIEQRCPIFNPVGEHEIERNSAAEPDASPYRSAKNLAALIQALRDFEGTRAWVQQQIEDPEVKRLLEADVDQAGFIASRWAEALRHQFTGLGVEFPRRTA
jgi:hypothetical protein